MNIIVKRENLLQALSFNIKSISTRTAIPVLNNVLFDVGKNKLTLTSTNLEQSIITFIGIENKDEWKCTINLKNFYEIITNLNSDTINISLNDNIFYLSDGIHEVNLNTIPEDEFPKISYTSNKDNYFIKTKPYELSFAIDKVSFATSKDQNKAILTGVLIEIREKNIKFIGINGFRFSSININFEDIKFLGKENIVISRDSLDNLSDIIKSIDLKKDTYIYIYKLSSNQILFEIENIKFITRLMEGKYPDYEKIFPKTYSSSFEIQKEDLKNIIKLSLPFKFKKISKISIHTDPKENKVYFQSSLKEVGDIKSNIKSNIKGKEINVSFDTRYIMDFLNHTDGEKLYIELNGAESKKISKITDTNLKNFTYLIMPLYER